MRCPARLSYQDSTALLMSAHPTFPTRRLKLPPYRTAQQIREKLLYAIQSGAGFELS